MRDQAYSALKDVVWLGSSKADLKAFPAAVMDDIGHQLFMVQMGLEPEDWKPMSVVGPGVREIRVSDIDLARKRLKDI